MDLIYELLMLGSIFLFNLPDWFFPRIQLWFYVVGRLFRTYVDDVWGLTDPQILLLGFLVIFSLGVYFFNGLSKSSIQNWYQQQIKPLIHKNILFKGKFIELALERIGQSTKFLYTLIFGGNNSLEYWLMNKKLTTKSPKSIKTRLNATTNDAINLKLLS
jgi:hypothetical protein